MRTNPDEIIVGVFRCPTSGDTRQRAPGRLRAPGAVGVLGVCVAFYQLGVRSWANGFGQLSALDGVVAWEGRYDVRVYPSAGLVAPDRAELDHLYWLYRNVHARHLDHNVYPLPRRLLDAIMRNPGWELVVLRLAGVGRVPLPTFLVTGRVGRFARFGAIAASPGLVNTWWF